MITADLIFLGIILLVVILGSCFGFGKCLEFVTKGVFGIIISVVVCYFIGGVVLELAFVQSLLADFISLMQAQDSAILNLLIKIRIDVIVYFLVLFLVVQVLRKVLVSLLKSVFETDNVAVKVVNKVLGVLLMAVFGTILILLALQIAFFFETAENTILNYFNGSFFGLDYLYTNNPLNNIINAVINLIPDPAVPGL